MSRARYLLVVAGLAVLLVLAAFGPGTEGTVVAKTGQGADDYACQAGGAVAAPVAVPTWGVCSAGRCWQLVVRSSDGDTSEPCVSRDEYDRTPLGAFWHGRTDR